MLPFLKLEDIQLGQTVKLCELEQIYNTYMLIASTRMVPDETGLPLDIEGEVIWIGDTLSKEVDDIQSSHEHTMLWFNNNNGEDAYCEF